MRQRSDHLAAMLRDLVHGFGVRSGAAVRNLLRPRTAVLDRQAAQLRESEERLRDFAEASSDWFWETDAEHRFTYLSDGIRAFG